MTSAERIQTAGGGCARGARAGRRRAALARAAGMLLACACVALAAPAVRAAESPSTKGWGAEATYIGRYTATFVPGARAPTRLAPAHAAIFDAIANSCQRLAAAGGTRPTSGELTMFMREVKKGKPLVPSGVLAMKAPAGNELLYLTYLSNKGGTLAAKINGGAFVGPVIGSFTGHRTGPDTILGTVSAEGIATVTASFSRFSGTAQP